MEYINNYKMFNEGLKDKDIFTFVRFGGLDTKKQKGYSTDLDKKTFHAPPTRRGFYAMPKIAQEFFLIGSLANTQPNVFGKERPTNNSYKDRLRDIRKEFRKTDGHIWHHLDEYVDTNKVLDRNGSWIKTDMKTWAKAFTKMSVKLRYGRQKYDLENNINRHGDGKGVTGHYSQDHCEVFIDEKV
jgi:hypothetical protein